MTRNIKWVKQAGAELCQAQAQDELGKNAIKANFLVTANIDKDNSEQSKYKKGLLFKVVLCLFSLAFVTKFCRREQRIFPHNMKVLSALVSFLHKSIENKVEVVLPDAVQNFLKSTHPTESLLCSSLTFSAAYKLLHSGLLRYFHSSYRKTL